jgi:hypothetical protein
MQQPGNLPTAIGLSCFVLAVVAILIFSLGVAAGAAFWLVRG